MRRFVSLASAFTLALLVGGQAMAQQPPANPPSGGTPDAMPFDIPYGMAITTEKMEQTNRLETIATFLAFMFSPVCGKRWSICLLK